MESSADTRTRLLAAARGDEKADVVLKGGTVVDVFSSELIKTDVAFCGSTIVGLGTYSGKKEIDCRKKYIAPGLIDAHMHMESSMLLPGELSKVLVKAGTTTIIADPHEAVNVSGTDALDYLLEATEHTLMDVYILIPSSVPAADSDTNGCGEFTPAMMKRYLHHPRVLGLGEVMRYRDVISGDSRMAEKLHMFSGREYRIDGHYPGGCGNDLQAYRLAGIENCHESTTGKEALEKLRSGLAVFIREGSGAKNLEAVVKGLLAAHVSLDNCMFCTDDKHTAEIRREGHISTCVHKAIKLGVPPVQAYRMGSWQTARFYGLRNHGAVAAGFKADILIMNKLDDTVPAAVIKNGMILTADDYAAEYDVPVPPKLRSTVHVENLVPDRIRVGLEDRNRVIGMIPGQLLTESLHEKTGGRDGFFMPDSRYNKICVFERHGRTGKAAAAPLKGFGIHGGAIATSVSHDAHNIIAAGDNDTDILTAAACIQEMQGGYAISSGGKITGKLPLPVCGLMSMQACTEVEETLAEMLKEAERLGIRKGIDPFITLSFMALTVIPSIRITDKGLVET
ncbi:MAG: adenine deaminase [Treponema sp.]|nr:adenine deaminase [Treponema sp.]